MRLCETLQAANRGYACTLCLSNGEVIANAIYDPWGNPTAGTERDVNFAGIDNVSNYTGYTWDDVLGLYFAQNRFYDSENHRFTQDDPVRDGANWYVYCGNNPGIYTDLFGLWSTKSVVNFGDTNNEDVKVLQLALQYLEFYNSANGITGNYGENTLKSVTTYKRQRLSSIIGSAYTGNVSSKIDSTTWQWLVDDVLNKWIVKKNWGDYFPKLTCTAGLGATGKGVALLQAGLMGVGYNLGVSSPTGYFGPSTLNAVKDYTGGNETMDQASWDRLRLELFLKVIGYNGGSLTSTWETLSERCKNFCCSNCCRSWRRITTGMAMCGKYCSK